MDASNCNQDLSKEDVILKERLESYVKQAQEIKKPLLRKRAIENLKEVLLASSNGNSCIDFPKLLTFLRPHYKTLKDHYHIRRHLRSKEGFDLKKLVADILSVLAVHLSESNERECLKYRKLGTDDDNIAIWGHEYVDKLAIQVQEEYAECCQNDEEQHTQNIQKGKLLDLMEKIVDFYMEKNSVIEAVNLLMEFRKPGYLLGESECVNQGNYKQTCLYLTSLAGLPLEDNRLILTIAYFIYLKFKAYACALQLALFMEYQIHVQQVFIKCDDLLQKKQLCYILARHGSFFKLDHTMVSPDKINELQKIINNSEFGQRYLDLAQDLGVMKPISPEDVYKGSKFRGPRRNLGDTFVSAFVNAGFGKDKLIMEQENWINGSKGKENMSAVACVGVIMLWDNAGLAELGKYLVPNDTYIFAGALIGTGIISEEFFHMRPYFENIHQNQSVRIGAIMALGISYANTRNERITDALAPIIKGHDEPLELVAFAAISLALVHIGSVNNKAAHAIL